MYLRVFWFGHFLMSKFKCKSSFLIKCYIIIGLNFFVERFVSKMAFQKMDFPLYFQQVIWVGRGEFFLPKWVSEKAKHSRIRPSCSGKMAKLNSVTALLSPLPIVVSYLQMPSSVKFGAI